VNWFFLVIYVYEVFLCRLKWQNPNQSPISDIQLHKISLYFPPLITPGDKLLFLSADGSTSIEKHIYESTRNNFKDIINLRSRSRVISAVRNCLAASLEINIQEASKNFYFRF
jgi:hypothetical protein